LRAVLLDIEGTTTPIAFVHETLFGYVRLHLDAWLAEHALTPEFAEVEAGFRDEHAADPDGRKALFAWRRDTVEDQRESIATYAWFLMDRDRKSTTLKTLQGWIWEAGYLAGELRGVVYEDVPRAFERWANQGLTVAIYSSGSELAQRRLFESTPHGDLTPYIRHHFDARVGAKNDAASYTRIAAAMGTEPQSTVFVSDVTKELAAAAEAGFETRLIVRPGAPAQSDAGTFRTIASFDELLSETTA
jgi:enolase-phosphatase E1